MATNYSKPTPTKVGYSKSIGGDKFYLLLQNGDFILLQDGSSRIILESSDKANVNYDTSTPTNTDYGRGENFFLLLQNASSLLLQNGGKLVLERDDLPRTNYSRGNPPSTNYTTS
ncbi:hypothetical protein LCGC14_1023980 [marine sediment metagenome]|uniref:Uncharacterized protein n=1 Tax=marine sediment metagenome TaxID=412755 RepID=A0A0F9QEL9_9ZZZZ